MDERLLTNIIPKENLRKVQYNVMKNVSDAVMKTAGPYGSNTLIMRANEFPAYSKDGKKVLDNIKYYGPLEKSIVDELSQLVTYVVKEVGDGTTSAIRMSYHIFKRLIDLENKSDWKDIPSAEIIYKFQDVTKKLQKNIIENGRGTTIEDIYKICMISTNGNEVLSKNISEIYEKYGLDVNIELQTSNDSDHKIKEYDGITIEKGYTSDAFINTSDGLSSLRNPRIYYFKDPVDTNEMVSMFSAIIVNNIMAPFSELREGKLAEMIPTVIICPSVTRDAEQLISELEQIMYSQSGIGKLPINIITQLNRYVDEIDDISRLCGCKPIKKYIDPEIQKKDMEEGKAPTPDTIYDWYGTAEEVISDSDKTKFINPSKMYDKDENGDFVESEIYKGMVNFLESAIKNAKDNNEDIVKIGKMKKRLGMLNANYVQYFVGGISNTDMAADKDLAEDAILNCRSAVRYGVGYGANFEGYRAAYNLCFGNNKVEFVDDIESTIGSIIWLSYLDFSRELYSTAMSENSAIEAVAVSMNGSNECPMNLRTKKYDGSVLSSINTDVTILDAISKIITVMFTANQGLTSDPMLNKYWDIKEEEDKSIFKE